MAVLGDNLGLKLTPDVLRQIASEDAVKSAGSLSQAKQVKVLTDKPDKYVSLSPEVFGSTIAASRGIVVPCSTGFGGSIAFEATKPAPFALDPSDSDLLNASNSLINFIDLDAIKRQFRNDPKILETLMSAIFIASKNQDSKLLNRILDDYGVKIQKQAGEFLNVMAAVPTKDPMNRLSANVTMKEVSMPIKSIVKSLNEAAASSEAKAKVASQPAAAKGEKLKTKKTSVKVAEERPATSQTLSADTQQMILDLVKSIVAKSDAPIKKKKKPKPDLLSKPVPTVDRSLKQLGLPDSVQLDPTPPRVKVLFDMGDQQGVMQASYHHVIQDCDAGIMLVYDTRFLGGSQYAPSPNRTAPFFVTVKGPGINIDKRQVRSSRCNFQFGVFDFVLLSYVIADAINPAHIEDDPYSPYAANSAQTEYEDSEDSEDSDDADDDEISYRGVSPAGLLDVAFLLNSDNEGDDDDGKTS